MGIPKDSTAQRWVTYFAYLASKERTSYTQSIEQDCLSVLKILAPLMLMRKDTMLSPGICVPKQGILFHIPHKVAKCFLLKLCLQSNFNNNKGEQERIRTGD